MYTKSNKKSPNGKATAQQNGIKIDFDSAIPIREGNLNSYGLDITNPDFIKFKKNNLEVEVIGGVNLHTLSKFNVLLKISKRPQLSPLDTYRNNVDLYNPKNVEYYIKEATAKLKMDSKLITEVIHDLMGRLEDYRKDMVSTKEVSFTINKPEPKQAKRVDKVLKGENIITELYDIIRGTGVPSPRTAFQLFVIGLSAKTKEVIHGVLQGSPLITNEILKSQAELLPEEHLRAVTSLTDNVLFYAPSKNYWRHKMLLLPSLDILSKKHNSLVEFIAQGKLNRFVTEADRTGIYRAAERKVNGPICLISATSKEYSSVMGAEDVLTIRLKDQSEIKAAISTNRIKAHAGLINEDEQQKSREFFHHIYRMIEPVKVVNTFLDQIDLEEAFDHDVHQIEFFLRITSLITMLHQKAIGRKKINGVESVEVRKEYMVAALELFKDNWVKDEDELPFNVAVTFGIIKREIKKQFPKDYKEQEFGIQEIRPKLKKAPQTVQRHLNALVDYGRLSRTGNRRDGYQYSVSNWEDTSSAEAYNSLLEQIKSL